MGKFGQNIFSLLSGLGIGYLIGILYAPGSGKDTRETLYYKLKWYQEKLQKIIDDYKNKSENITVAKSEGDRIVRDATEQAEILLKDVEDLMHQIKSANKKSD